MSFTNSITSLILPYAEDTINAIRVRMQDRKAIRLARRHNKELQNNQENTTTVVAMNPETEASFLTWLSSVVDSTNTTLPINNPEQSAQSEPLPVALPEIATPIEGSTRRRGWWAKDMQHWTPEQMKAVLDHYGQEGLRENTYNYLRRRVGNQNTTTTTSAKWENTPLSDFYSLPENAARGIRNNNWGNIRISTDTWLGKLKDNSDGTFEQFASPELGIRAMAINLRNYNKLYNKRTIAELIDRWAPTNENDTKAYIELVSNYTGIGAHEDVTDRLWNDDEFMFKLLKAISIKENGGARIDAIANADQIIRSGLAMANKRRYD